MFKNLRKNKKGFSLVELIVVIAVMAVLLAVLAPSLLQYVERSRAQKDDSAMSEVVNAIKLAMADQDVYDELLPYNERANVSGLIDGITDEEPWTPDGVLRGVTITFTPENHIVKLADGKINSLMEDPASTKQGIMSELSGPAGAKQGVLYNKVRVAVGDTIELTSQTYRNSPYTVFIAMGTLGGNDPSEMNAINVYGQWGGTNLPEGTIYDEGDDETVLCDGTINCKATEHDPDCEKIKGGVQMDADDYLPNAYVLLLDNSEDSDNAIPMIFVRESEAPVVGETYESETYGALPITAVYSDFEARDFDNSWENRTPWSDDSYYNITSVVVEDKISPISTAKWFADFMACKSFDLQKLDTSNVTNMSCMFGGIFNLEGKLDLSNFDTRKVTNMSSMFWSLTWKGLEIDLSSFDTSNVTNMSCMFCENWYLDIDISHFNTSKVEDMSSMFQGFSGVESLDLSNFDTSNVKYMSQMFDTASELTELDLSSFDTSSVEDMTMMFMNCSGLTSLDLSGFDTRNVESMYEMFYCCENLTTIYASELWNDDSVTNSDGMFGYGFGGCKKLSGAVLYNNSNANDVTYANYDTGYFTYKQHQ